ncbi:hypothetical protein BDV18DRAFT_49974 [Aspergillus unguis]
MGISFLTIISQFRIVVGVPEPMELTYPLCPAGMLNGDLDGPVQRRILSAGQSFALCGHRCNERKSLWGPSNRVQEEMLKTRRGPTWRKRDDGGTCFDATNTTLSLSSLVSDSAALLLPLPSRSFDEFSSLGPCWL